MHLLQYLKKHLNIIFLSNSIRNNLITMRYLPRWIVFFMDIFLTICSIGISYIIIRSLRVTFYTTLDFTYRFGLILFVNIIFFLVFKTYSGIIRHSTFLDGIKLLYATICSFIVLVMINYSTYFSIGKKIYVLPSLFIHLVIIFSVLFLFRIFVKFLFENFINEKRKANLVRAIIYGSDANAISVVNALRSEKPTRFRIIGFVDKNNQDISKRILDIPILNSRKKISVIMRSLNAEAIIIADNSLTKEEKLLIVDDCLEFNYQVFTAPTVANWEDQVEISKKVMNFQIQDLLDRKSIVLDQKQISNQLKNKTILITGAAGSIGSEIARQIVDFDPKNIIILDQAETPLHFLKSELEMQISEVKIKTLICDIRNKESLNEIFCKYKPQVVFHAAAYKHVPMMEENPSQAIFANVLGTKNAADLSFEHGVKNFVFVSSDKAVNPSNVMGASKRIAEKYVQSLFFNIKNENSGATKFITTRFGNVLGSNGSVVPLFTEQIRVGGPITITHPDIIRYFMTIPEACQLVLEAGAMGNGGEIYIFDMGKPVKIIDLATKMIRLAGLIPEKDIKIKIVGLRPGEKLYEELLNDTSKSIPTHHEKILIAKEICNDYSNFSNEVDELITIANSYKNDLIVSKMKQIVPEFISMNSEFNELDN
ncbi:COG1086 Predicted nucleoside-diphosphate sugar epimerases [Flavobacteriaceae bacterium]